MTATTAGEPRWATVPEAVAYSGIPGTTIRRWISHGYVTAYRRGPHKLLVDLDALDAMSKRASPPRQLSEDDERLARQVAAALLPLAPRQREKLAALLLNMDGEHDAA